MSDDIRDVLRKLIPIIGEDAVRRAWEALQIADARTAKLIEASLRRKLADATGTYDGRGILLEPIPADKASGSIHLGQVIYADKPLHPFGLRQSELMQHLAIFGRSGAGKTNTCFVMLRELSRLKVPFLVLDWKSQYRDLMSVPGFEKLVVYTVGRDTAPFFFNPLVPPRGSEPKEWIKKLVEIMQHAYFLGEGVAYVLQEVIDAVYQDFGVYSNPTVWPTMRHIKERLEAREVKGRSAGWTDSAVRALGVLNFGAMDAVLNSGIPFPMQRLLKQQAVLELEAISDADKRFLIESLLLWIHHYRMYESGREQLKHLLLVEEAHHILTKKKQEITGAETITETLLREVREYGQAIAVVDQLPQFVSKPALENSYATIAMNLKEEGDVTAAAKAMLLDTEQKKYLGHLGVGWGVVKLQARWTHPFLVQFPRFEVRKGSVTNAQVAARWVDAMDAPTYFRMFAREFMQFADLFKEVVIPRLQQGVAEQTAPSAPSKSSKSTPALTPEQDALLRDVATLPASTITDRYQRLSFKPERGTALVKELVDIGYLRESVLTVGTRHIRLLTLTTAARERLGLPPEQDRLGGPEHRFWAEVFAGALRSRDLPVVAEAPVGDGQTIDLVTNVNDERIAIEVETGKSDWRANVEKCLKHATKVIVAVTNEDAFQRIRAAARELAETERVRVVRAEDLVAWIESGRFPADSSDSGSF